MLHGWPPNTVQPGDVVLVWDGSGGLGSLAVQLVSTPAAVPSPSSALRRRASTRRASAPRATSTARDFTHWGVPPAWDAPEWKDWFAGAKAFGKAIWEVLGEKKSPQIVFEHPGQDTIPTSNFVCDRGGMIVICAGTSATTR